MARLKDKVQYALDEARLLILGAQVLLGFQYRAAFETGFEKLPVQMQYLRLVALTLMLIALALLIWPGAYHRIVSAGEDTENLHMFTTRVMEVALFPFALAFSIEIFAAAERIAGMNAGIVIGLLTVLMTLAFWYGWELIDRSRHRTKKHTEGEVESEHTRTKLRDKIEHVLTETRVVLPGAQALLGFQLATTLMDGFDKLPNSSKYVHLASLCMIAVCTILLMTPAAYHRIVEKGEATDHFHRFASRVLLAAMVPLALGVCGDFFVVTRKITESVEIALTAATLSLALFCGLWFGLTAYWRNSQGRRERWATGGGSQPAAG